MNAAEECAQDLDRIRELGRAWMRASLAERPADPDQQRRIRVLLVQRKAA